MPATTTADLSSNWKKLQAKLGSEKKSDSTTSTSNGIKRKRPMEKTSSTKPAPRYINKAKVTGDNASSLGKKKRKMGSYISTPAADSNDTTTAKSLASLTTDHDIPAADLTAAYGSSHSRSSRPSSAKAAFDDEINGGLHPAHRAGKYLALDCEMVGTGPPPHSDDLLARVSLVNFHGEQVYDSYVQPPGKARVEDYRTFVSGVTKWHLRPDYARPFAEVQKLVADLLHDKILVGHALKKDLEALQLTHPKRDIRDTSRYAPFRVESKGKPPALRNLARSELGLTIQTGEHSSVEDARATMALFRKEKQGFEEDNRKVFGTKRRVPVGKAQKQREESVEDDEDKDGEDDEDSDLGEEDEDLDLLEGEEDLFAEVDEEGSNGKKKKAAPDKKKKKKKKSRTKRK